jgi:iron complex outermembrane receptor protein
LSPVGVEVDELPLYQYSQNDASLYGGEFTVKYQPFDWVRLSSQAAVVRGKLDDGNYLPFMPHDKIETGLRLMKKRMGIFRQSFVALQGVYAFEQSRPSRFETITPAWFITNITAGASIILSDNEINVSFVVKNLFNKTYADHLSTIKSLGYYNPGRGSVVRLEWVF